MVEAHESDREMVVLSDGVVQYVTLSIASEPL